MREASFARESASLLAHSKAPFGRNAGAPKIEFLRRAAFQAKPKDSKRQRRDAIPAQREALGIVNCRYKGLKARPIRHENRSWNPFMERAFSPYSIGCSRFLGFHPRLI